MSNGGGSGSGGSNEPDASCPAVHFSPMATTPSIALLIDRSGSMLNDFADNTPTGPTDPIKYDTVESALVGNAGIVTALQAKVFFGATLFSDDGGAVCPTLKEAPRAQNNLAVIQPLIHNNRPIANAHTPTPPSIDAVVADFKANPPPTGSPPVIVLATDGLPNMCGSNTSTTAQSVASAKAAFAAGIRLFVLGVGTNQAAQTHLQDMANAGLGVQAGQPNATAFQATNPTELATAFSTIIRGVVSCDLALNGMVTDPGSASTAIVTLNGMTLTFGTDWTLDPNGTVIHLLGTACETLKTSANPVVDATFDCGGAIIF